MSEAIYVDVVTKKKFDRLFKDWREGRVKNTENSFLRYLLKKFEEEQAHIKAMSLIDRDL